MRRFGRRGDTFGGREEEKEQREEGFEEVEEESGGAGGEPTAMDASNLLASVSNRDCSLEARVKRTITRKLERLPKTC